MIKLAKGIFIEREKIMFIASYSNNMIRTKVRDKRKEGRVFNASFGKSTNCAIFLHDGYVFLTNSSPEIICQRLEENKKGITTEE